MTGNVFLPETLARLRQGLKALLSDCVRVISRMIADLRVRPCAKSLVIEPVAGSEEMWYSRTIASASFGTKWLGIWRGGQVLPCEERPAATTVCSVSTDRHASSQPLGG